MIDVAGLVAEHGSPLWIVDLDRVRENLAGLRTAWAAEWPDVTVAYSLKTNRLPAIAGALVTEGAHAEAVCAPEYALARDVLGVPGSRVVVNGPVKPDALLTRAGADGALVIADSAAEVERMSAAGVQRAGLRVSIAGIGGGPSRFGIAPDDIPVVADRARALGMTVEALACHLVSTDLIADPGAARGVAAAVEVRWPRPAGDHVAAARLLGGLAVRLGVPTVDMGGGMPPPAGVTDHVHGIAAALRAERFSGRILVEPGRALVADTARLVMTVVAVKHLPTGPVVIADAGTNLLPGALWSWPRITPLDDRPGTPTLVTGPLCLNIDVLNPSALLPALAPGDLLVAEGVGAYQDAQSTQFGDLRPAVVVIDRGSPRLARAAEAIRDGLRLD